MTYRVLKGISIKGHPKVLKGDDWPDGIATSTQVADLIDCGALEPLDTVPESDDEPEPEDEPVDELEGD